MGGSCIAFRRIYWSRILWWGKVYLRYASISRSLLPYNRSLLPYNRSLLTLKSTGIPQVCMSCRMCPTHIPDKGHVHIPHKEHVPYTHTGHVHIPHTDHGPYMTHALRGPCALHTHPTLTCALRVQAVRCRLYSTCRSIQRLLDSPGVRPRERGARGGGGGGGWRTN